MAEFAINSAEVALSAAATKSLILLNPAGAEFVLEELSVTFGSDPGEDPRVELYRVTTLGTPAGTATTPSKEDPGSQAADTTALTNLTTEPTAVEVMRTWKGPITVQNPLGSMPKGVSAGARIGVRVVTAASVNPTAVAYAKIAE